MLSTANVSSRSQPILGGDAHTHTHTLIHPSKVVDYIIHQPLGTAVNIIDLHRIQAHPRGLHWSVPFLPSSLSLRAHDSTTFKKRANRFKSRNRSNNLQQRFLMQTLNLSPVSQSGYLHTKNTAVWGGAVLKRWGRGVVPCQRCSKYLSLCLGGMPWGWGDSPTERSTFMTLRPSKMEREGSANQLSGSASSGRGSELLYFISAPDVSQSPLFPLRVSILNSRSDTPPTHPFTSRKDAVQIIRTMFLLLYEAETNGRILLDPN